MTKEHHSKIRKIANFFGVKLESAEGVGPIVYTVYIYIHTIFGDDLVYVLAKSTCSKGPPLEVLGSKHV